MNLKNTKKLYKDFDYMFRERTSPMSSTCMCWGFECGDGWFYLIYKLCTDIQKYLDKHPKLKNTFAITQVKEKYGGLVVYTNIINKTISNLINKAERNSYKICEVCGNVGTCNYKGWLTTLCNKCRQNNY